MKNRELSLHQAHEFMLKLEQAGLDHFLTQLVIESPENQLAKHLVASLLFNHFKIDLKSWITLKPVSYNRGQLLAQYKIHNCDTRGSSGLILNKKNLYKLNNAIQLAAFTYEELGYDNQQVPTFKEVCTRAQLIGLELCPPEIGPILRLLYLTQPRDETMLIGMKPIIIQNDKLIFCLTHDIFGLDLDIQNFYSCLPVQKNNTKWVFVIPNK